MNVPIDSNPSDLEIKVLIGCVTSCNEDGGNINETTYFSMYSACEGNIFLCKPYLILLHRYCDIQQLILHGSGRYFRDLVIAIATDCLHGAETKQNSIGVPTCKRKFNKSRSCDQCCHHGKATTTAVRGPGTSWTPTNQLEWFA